MEWEVLQVMNLEQKGDIRVRYLFVASLLYKNFLHNQHLLLPFLARTLAFDAEGKWLYVSIGSNGNVDGDSFRSRIRRFDISTYVNQPFAYNDGEIFADGLRNEVGLAFDSYGDLWGVENGADNLYRSDLGGDM